MSWTKRQFVNAAFEMVGLSSFTFDMQPQDLQAACRQLDAMMGSWNAKGVRIGYPIPTSPENTDLDTETEVPDAANEAIYTNLALRVATMFGRQVMPDLKQNAFKSYRTLLSWNSQVREMQFPGTLPRGQGNKPWTDDNRFIDNPTETLDVGNDDVLEFN